MSTLIKEVAAVLPTPWGPFEICGSEQGIHRARFVAAQTPLSSKIPDLLQAAAGQLADYLAGDLERFSLPLAPEGSAFQQRVWQSLQQIPYGHSISYKQQALALGDPKAIRATAAANGKNPIAIFIPCHRVLGSDGTLTGYAWGIDIKKALLALEGRDTQMQLLI